MPTAYVDGTVAGKNQATLVAQNSEIRIDLDAQQQQAVSWFTPAGNPAGAAFALEALFGVTWFGVGATPIAGGAAAAAIAAGASECREALVNGADAVRLRRTDGTVGQASGGITVAEV